MQDMIMKKKWYVIIDTETLNVSIKKMCENEAHHLQKIKTYKVFGFNSQEEAEKFKLTHVMDCCEHSDAFNINVTINMCDKKNECVEVKENNSEDLLLLAASALLLVNYCPKTEHDLEHVFQLVDAAKIPNGQKYPQSDLDKIFEQIKFIDPCGLALKVYELYKKSQIKKNKPSFTNPTYCQRERKSDFNQDMSLKDLLNKIKRNDRQQTVDEWMRGNTWQGENSSNSKKRRDQEDEFFF